MAGPTRNGRTQHTSISGSAGAREAIDAISTRAAVLTRGGRALVDVRRTRRTHVARLACAGVAVCPIIA